MLRLTLGIALAIVLTLAYALWPVCAPIPPETVAGFDPPIDQRTDAMLWGRVFRQRDDGQWQQCKTRLSRAFFF